MKPILVTRYLTYAIFLLCNAVITAVSVWNFLIAESVELNLQVDAFLIVIGAIGIFFHFTMIYVEIIRKNSVTCRVWFESLWVGIFFALNFAGAVALSALVPSLMCDPGVILVVSASCSSTSVLLAFVWINSAILLVYLVSLTIAAALYSTTDSRVWNRTIRQFANSEALTAQSRSMEQTHRKGVMSIVAPRPTRPTQGVVYAFSQGISSDDYDKRQSSAPKDVGPSRPRPSTRPAFNDANSFYPQHMQKVLNETRPAKTPLPPIQTSTITTPPPLGNWPRANIMSEPVYKKKSTTNGSQLTIATRATRSTTSSEESLPVRQPSPPKTTPISPPSFPPSAYMNTSTSPTRRPSGPRSKVLGSKPPPLNLSEISSYRRLAS